MALHDITSNIINSPTTSRLFDELAAFGKEKNTKKKKLHRLHAAVEFSPVAGTSSCNKENGLCDIVEDSISLSTVAKRLAPTAVGSNTEPSSEDAGQIALAGQCSTPGIRIPEKSLMNINVTDRGRRQKLRSVCPLNDVLRSDCDANISSLPIKETAELGNTNGEPGNERKRANSRAVLNSLDLFSPVAVSASYVSSSATDFSHSESCCPSVADTYRAPVKDTVGGEEKYLVKSSYGSSGYCRTAHVADRSNDAHLDDLLEAILRDPIKPIKRKGKLHSSTTLSRDSLKSVKSKHNGTAFDFVEPDVINGQASASTDLTCRQATDGGSVETVAGLLLNEEDAKNSRIASYTDSVPEGTEESYDASEMQMMSKPVQVFPFLQPTASLGCESAALCVSIDNRCSDESKMGVPSADGEEQSDGLHTPPSPRRQEAEVQVAFASSPSSPRLSSPYCPTIPACQQVDDNLHTPSPRRQDAEMQVSFASLSSLSPPATSANASPSYRPKRSEAVSNYLQTPSPRRQEAEVQVARKPVSLSPAPLATPVISSPAPASGVNTSACNEAADARVSLASLSISPAVSSSPSPSLYKTAKKSSFSRRAVVDSDSDDDLEMFLASARKTMHQRAKATSDSDDVLPSLTDFVVPDDAADSGDEGDESDDGSNDSVFYITTTRAMERTPPPPPLVASVKKSSTAVKRPKAKPGADDSDFKTPINRGRAGAATVRSRPQPIAERQLSPSQAHAAQTCPRPKLHDMSLPQRAVPNSADRGSSRPDFLFSLNKDLPEHRRHIEAHRYVINFKKTKDELTQRLFSIFNETIFSNKMPTDMKMVWNNRLTKTAGRCVNRRVTSAAGIAVRISFIELSDKILDSADRLRDTLLHEMCHAAVWLFNGQNDGHGLLWRAWAGKAHLAHPRIPMVNVCHNYDIATKYIYECSKCGYRIGRHSKSLDTTRKVCGHCRGVFVLVTVNGRTPRSQSAKSVSSTSQRPPLTGRHSDGGDDSDFDAVIAARTPSMPSPSSRPPIATRNTPWFTAARQLSHRPATGIGSDEDDGLSDALRNKLSFS